MIKRIINHPFQTALSIAIGLIIGIVATVIAGASGGPVVGHGAVRDDGVKAGGNRAQ